MLCRDTHRTPHQKHHRPALEASTTRATQQFIIPMENSTPIERGPPAPACFDLI